jgi:diacylglycerol kinase
MKEKSEKFSLQKRLKSFSYAFNGIINLIIYEHNARIHFVALFCVVVLGLLLHIEPFEWIAITVVSGMVIVSEIFNSALEHLSDYVEPGKNRKIGIIKDYCAAAVLISAITSLIVGGIIFIPKIAELLKG